MNNMTPIVVNMEDKELVKIIKYLLDTGDFYRLTEQYPDIEEDLSLHYGKENLYFDEDEMYKYEQYYVKFVGKTVREIKDTLKGYMYCTAIDNDSAKVAYIINFINEIVTISFDEDNRSIINVCKKSNWRKYDAHYKMRETNEDQ